MNNHDDGLEEFERELGVALRRVDAPVGFADGVMDRAGRGTVLAFPFARPGAWIGSLAASLLVSALLVGGVEHRRASLQTQAERARAERDFARSLEITDRAMDQTRERLQRVGVVVD